MAGFVSSNIVRGDVEGGSEAFKSPSFNSLISKKIFTVYTDVGLPARSQYSEGPATGHLDTGFLWFPMSL